MIRCNFCKYRQALFREHFYNTNIVSVCMLFISHDLVIHSVFLLYNLAIDLSLNSKCNGLCFIQIGALEVEISFLFVNNNF